MDVNSIANRTLISNETNGRIKDKAPADYIDDPAIFPSGAQPGLMEPHFINDESLLLIRTATEELTYQQAMDIYHHFLPTREAAMIEEIRRACGIAAATGTREDAVPDDVAEDIRAGAAAPEDEAEEVDAAVQFA